MILIMRIDLVASSWGLMISTLIFQSRSLMMRFDGLLDQTGRYPKQRWQNPHSPAVCTSNTNTSFTANMATTIQQAYIQRQHSIITFYVPISITARQEIQKTVDCQFGKDKKVSLIGNTFLSYAVCCSTSICYSASFVHRPFQWFRVIASSGINGSALVQPWKHSETKLFILLSIWG